MRTLSALFCTLATVLTVNAYALTSQTLYTCEMSGEQMASSNADITLEVLQVGQGGRSAYNLKFDFSIKLPSPIQGSTVFETINHSAFEKRLQLSHYQNSFRTEFSKTESLGFLLMDLAPYQYGIFKGQTALGLKGFAGIKIGRRTYTGEVFCLTAKGK